MFDQLLARLVVELKWLANHPDDHLIALNTIFETLPIDHPKVQEVLKVSHINKYHDKFGFKPYQDDVKKRIEETLDVANPLASVILKSLVEVAENCVREFDVSEDARRHYESHAQKKKVKMTKMREAFAKLKSGEASVDGIAHIFEDLDCEDNPCSWYSKPSRWAPTVCSIHPAKGSRGNPYTPEEWALVKDEVVKADTLKGKKWPVGSRAPLTHYWTHMGAVACGSTDCPVITGTSFHGIMVDRT